MRTEFVSKMEREDFEEFREICLDQDLIEYGVVPASLFLELQKKKQRFMERIYKKYNLYGNVSYHFCRFTGEIHELQD